MTLDQRSATMAGAGLSAERGAQILIDINVPFTVREVEQRLKDAAASSPGRFGEQFQVQVHGRQLTVSPPPLTHESPRAVCVGSLDELDHGCRVQIDAARLAGAARGVVWVFATFAAVIGLAVVVQQLKDSDPLGAGVAIAVAVVIVGGLSRVTHMVTDAANAETSAFVTGTLTGGSAE